MIDIIPNQHPYLILNGAFIASYITVRAILILPFFKSRMLQSQRLAFARSSILIGILSFMIAPKMLTMLSSSTSVLQVRPIINSVIQFNMFLIPFFAIGFTFFIGKYFTNILTLRNVYKNSFCLHQIKNIHILLNDKQDVPFCWSTLRRHFIIIPTSFLEKNSEMRLAVQHELQHIRQGDTYWLHFFMIFHAICFWNPFIKLWINWLTEAQEFACDESLVLRKKTSPFAYATCLIKTASNTLKKTSYLKGVIRMYEATKSILYRRINMLFNYKERKAKTLAILLAYILSFFTAISTAYAFNTSTPEILSGHIQSVIIKNIKHT